MNFARSIKKVEIITWGSLVSNIIHQTKDLKYRNFTGKTSASTKGGIA